MESPKGRQSLLWRNKHNRNQAGTPDGAPAFLFVDGDLQMGLAFTHGSSLAGRDLLLCSIFGFPGQGDLQVLVLIFSIVIVYVKEGPITQ